MFFSTVGWGEERTPTTSFSLAIAAFIVAADSSAPVVVNHLRLDIPVDARIRPIRRPVHMAVFHRIEMDVIHMSRKIPFIADEVFPIPALPDAAFSFVRPAGAPAFPLGDMPRESRFDEHPPPGVVRVPWRQGPHRMQVFRQNHYRRW